MALSLNPFALAELYSELEEVENRMGALKGRVSTLLIQLYAEAPIEMREFIASSVPLSLLSKVKCLEVQIPFAMGMKGLGTMAEACQKCIALQEAWKDQISVESETKRHFILLRLRLIKRPQ